MGLGVGTCASSLEFETGVKPQGSGLGLKAGFWGSMVGFGLGGWDLDLKIGIWALRLGFGPQDGI